MFSKKLVIACAAAAAFGLYGTAAQASVTDFDSFTDGTVNGQNGWTTVDSFGNGVVAYDQAVVDLGGGNKVWRMSNGVTSGSYSNQPSSPSAPAIAGETGAVLLNDFGPNHVTPYNPPQSSGTASTNFFYSAWDFKSATGAAQAGLALTVSPTAKQSSLRMSYLQMQDTGSGFDLLFYETGAGGSFDPTIIATGLSYTDWHRVEMGIEFVDGLGAGVTGNDIVSIMLDGNLIHTGTTWESYYASYVDGGATTDKRAVDSLLFRASGSPAVGTQGAGFYFDNVEVSNRAITQNNATPTPEPATAGLLGLGLLAVAARRRRRA